MQHIPNYKPIHSRLATSGQPSAAQFSLIKQQGFEVVINLALTTASNAIEHEDQIVLNLGMNYIHLPLLWEAPTLAQAKNVLATLQQLHAQYVWLHCAKNYRVSALMSVYEQQVLGISSQDALAHMHTTWTPNAIWQQLITDLLLDTE